LTKNYLPINTNIACIMSSYDLLWKFIFYFSAMLIAIIAYLCTLKEIIFVIAFCVWIFYVFMLGM